MTEDGSGLLHVLIVDRQVASRRALRSALEDDPAVGPIEECGSGAAAVAAAERALPDLLLVRMELPDASAFDLLERLESGDHATILIAENPRDAARAFEARAVDCLVEPFDADRLERALDRAKEELNRRRALRLFQELNRVLEDGESANGGPRAGRASGPAVDGARRVGGSESTSRERRIVLTRAGRMVVVRTADIDRVEAVGCYARIHCREDTYLYRITMTELEDALGSEGFFRIHRSHLVRLDRIREVRTQDSGAGTVYVKDGTRLPVARRRRAALLEALLDLGSIP